ncbi:hypothetical protein GCM10009593_33590 [Microlunatus antarcticus]
MQEPDQPHAVEAVQPAGLHDPDQPVERPDEVVESVVDGHRRTALTALELHGFNLRRPTDSFEHTFDETRALRC